MLDIRFIFENGVINRNFVLEGSLYGVLAVDVILMKDDEEKRYGNGNY